MRTSYLIICLACCLVHCKHHELDADAVSVAVVTLKQAQLDTQLAAIVTDAPSDAASTGIDAHKPPADYVEVTIRAANGHEFGDAIVLIDEKEARIVPIYIGGTEALSIRLRLEERRFQRPLTHDLLDSMLQQLGAKLLRVQVDDLRGDVYIGTVIIEKDGRVIALDSRPSDAIALAVGNGVPVFASQRLLENAGIKVDDLPRKAPSGHEPIAL